MWVERWHHLLKQLERQGAWVHPLEIKPVATEQELIIVEERLGVRIPSEFRDLLRHCSQQVGVYWSLPDEALLPIELDDIPSGDFGWSLEGLDFPYFGGDDEDSEEQLYLQFHTAGNGDALLIRIDDGSVWYWSHEEDEFDLLAGSFNDYVERVTALGCLGADCGQHRQFCSEDGLDLSLTSSQIWLKWFEQYLTLTLKQAMSNMESLLMYVSMHGVKDSKAQEAFAQFDSSEVYHTLRNKIEQSLSAADKKAWCEVLVQVCAIEAREWVRTLWNKENEMPNSLRDYLTAYCLPAEEGLSLVLQDIEKQTIDSYTALHRLRHFHNPKIITWMKHHVAFPIDGWDTLLSESQPSAELLFEWLNGSEVERQTAIRAACQMMQQGIKPTTLVDKEKWRQLLAFWKENEILRKNKQLFSQALEGLDSSW
ncbi:SMI1/KNR4 family protein [Lysinibacillus sp. fls2-241-R2A-57]|uniref:SMI1/KNR4 family protein n=1 Tax=Lysinibacillus sp. fls2-241-R2A-57 TaxID=3040292 RepID=UPI0025559D69|nr:SMI1/KNR4 family protein [Lysinibacillus sp. fls2-241-R2A-57]